MNLNIPLLSPSSLLLGAIDQSQISAFWLNSLLSDMPSVWTIDRSSGSLTTNSSVVATSGIPDAFLPFGTDKIPADAVVHLRDSVVTDDWATRELTFSIEDSQGNIFPNPADAFRQVGWIRINIEPKTDRKVWRSSNDINLAMPKLKYIELEIESSGAAATDPFLFTCMDGDIQSLFMQITTAGSPTQEVKCAQVYCLRDNLLAKWNNYTSAFTGSITSLGGAADTPILTLQGEVVYIGFAGITEALDEYMFRAKQVAVTYKTEYSTSSTFNTLTDYTSGADYFQNGPAVYTEPPQHYTATWSAPTDWAKRSLTFFNESTASVEVTPELYWIRQEVLTVSDQSPSVAASHSWRAKTLGDATTKGMKFVSPLNIRALQLYFRGPITGVGETVLSLVDLASDTQVKTRSITIPSTVTQGDHLTVAITDISVSKLGLLHISGSRQYADVTINFEE